MRRTYRICSTASARRDCRRSEAKFGGSLRERVRCSSLVDWPVYPRLTGIMLTTTSKRNPASKSNRSDAELDRLTPCAAPSMPARRRARQKTTVDGLGGSTGTLGQPRTKGPPAGNSGARGWTRGPRASRARRPMTPARARLLRCDMSTPQAKNPLSGRRDLVAVTPQIAEAQQMARGWKPTK
jgi:hypothetical protein